MEVGLQEDVVPLSEKRAQEFLNCSKWDAAVVHIITYWFSSTVAGASWPPGWADQCYVVLLTQEAGHIQCCILQSGGMSTCLSFVLPYSHSCPMLGQTAW